jgi:EAL domain-containing protein (putative c-di-GMP-specific phosphodiesterase class I)
MLLSELEERERRFKLALRAGVPIVLLISLVFYSTFLREERAAFNLESFILFGSLLFITVYFIYFLMDLSAKESLIDQTTQSFNEKTFVRKLEKYHPKILVMLYIKNLSTINENYSTETVDRLLYTIIRKLNRSFQSHRLSNALIARRYGAEFLIAIDQDVEIETIFNTFIRENQLIDTIEVDYVFAAITNISQHLESDMHRLKDIITMQLKEEKRNKKPIIKDSKELSEMETSILQALKKKNFILSFRPLWHTRTHQIDIYEIAVKLYGHKNTPILPRTYLPTINRLGLGLENDTLLYRHVLHLLPLVDKKVSFSFNLSPFSLRDENFQKKFFQDLEVSQVDPKRIIIELYERKTHHNLSGYLHTLRKFRAHGVRIAIDNFGSSNASMEYMKHFHFDLVQFDRDYVTKLEDKNTFTMLHSLVTMSKELNIVTVAKWVDKPAQKQRLSQLGIDYLQGFGIAKPLSEKHLIAHYN